MEMDGAVSKGEVGGTIRIAMIDEALVDWYVGREEEEVCSDDAI